MSYNLKLTVAIIAAVTALIYIIVRLVLGTRFLYFIYSDNPEKFNYVIKQNSFVYGVVLIFILILLGVVWYTF